MLHHRQLKVTDDTFRLGRRARNGVLWGGILCWQDIEGQQILSAQKRRSFITYRL